MAILTSFGTDKMTNPLLKTAYNLFLKRSVIYVPVVLGGAFFFNEAIDTGLETLWDNKNKGKLYKHMSFPDPAASEE